MLKLCLVPPSSPPPITLRAVDDTRGFFVIAPAARCLTVLFLHLKVIYSAWLVAFLVLLHCYIVQLSSALGSGHLTPAFTSFIEINRRHPHAAYPRRRPLYVIPDDVAHHCITASDFYERPVAPQPTVLQRIGPACVKSYTPAAPLHCGSDISNA